MFFINPFFILDLFSYVPILYQWDIDVKYVFYEGISVAQTNYYMKYYLNGRCWLLNYYDIFMNLYIDGGAGLTAYHKDGEYFMSIDNNKSEISKEFFIAILKEFKSDDNDEAFYQAMVNESMKKVWDNNKDSIYDTE